VAGRSASDAFCSTQVDCLVAENRILKERLGDRKLQFVDAVRRRLAVIGKELCRKAPATCPPRWVDLRESVSCCQRRGALRFATASIRG